MRTGAAFRTVVMLGIGLVLLVACGGESGQAGGSTATTAVETSTSPLGTDNTANHADTPSDNTPGVQQVAFSTDVAPILSDNCATCHTAGGPGSPHWELSSAKDAVTFAPFIEDNISTGTMPPWPASALGVSFHDDRSLSEAEVSTLLDWIDQGAQLDVADDAVVEASQPVFTLAEPDEVITPATGYQGSTDIEDDYRCLAYRPDITEPTAVVGFEFLPDQTEVVHHAVGAIAPASSAERIDELDGQDGQPGWNCFGIPRIEGQGGTIMAWAPGQGPTVYPEGTGITINPGDTFILNIHYHYDDAAPVDSSSLALDYADPGDLPIDELQARQYVGPAEIPCATDETGPFCDRDAAMARVFERYGAAGAVGLGINQSCGVTPEDFADMTNGTASSSCDMAVRNPGEVVSVFAHQHELGATWRMTINPDTPDEQILLDIPRWDFDWQYNYYPEESIVLEADDVLRLECSWDRSLAAPGTEPAYVLWANGTGDEMCYTNLITRP